MGKSLRECVIVDGVRSANTRAHKDKGWFRNLSPDQILTAVYDGLFARNPQVKPEDIDMVWCGCSHISSLQYDIGRFAWLAGGFPDQTATVTMTQMCPSGMAATENAARAIMCGDGDIFIASGCEDMLKVPQGTGCTPPHACWKDTEDRSPLSMGLTAEKVAQLWNVSEGSGKHGLLEP